MPRAVERISSRIDTRQRFAHQKLWQLLLPKRCDVVGGYLRPAQVHGGVDGCGRVFGNVGSLRASGLDVDPAATPSVSEGALGKGLLQAN